LVSSRLHLETLEDRLVPSTMAGIYDDGTWRYDTSAGWSHISTLQADSLAVDDAGDVFGKYTTGTAGLWRWSASTQTWKLLSSQNVGAIRVTAGGIFYGDFASIGTWRWSPTTGWLQMSNLSPVLLADSEDGTFFGRYDTGVVGTWRWTPLNGWTKLSPATPDALQADGQGDLVGIYNTGALLAANKGTWRWSPSSGWTRLDPNVAYHIATSANGAIYEDRVGTGIWYAAPGATSFVQIDSLANSTWPATDALRALPDGSVYYQYQNSVTGHDWGWYWNPSQPGLGNVNIIPNAYSVFMGFADEGYAAGQGAVGKDNDLFFTGVNSTAGYWSLTTTYHYIGGGAGGIHDFGLAGQR
jgi:hypothetical protein